MSKPDYQKREATRSLWDNDGYHMPKKHRKKGSGRWADRRDIARELTESDPQAVADLDMNDLIYEESSEAYYCHFYGPCPRCRDDQIT